MPHTKEYKGKKSSTHHKRRPRHEMPETEIDTEELEAEEINTEALNEGLSAEQAYEEAPIPSREAKETIEEKAFEAAYDEAPSQFSTEDGSAESQEKIHLNFYGSELIRQKAPQVMELADTVADEWMKDGQFQGLPVGNPLAQLAAAKALRTAKDVEKKLDEAGVIAMAKMGFDYLKSKIEKR